MSYKKNLRFKNIVIIVGSGASIRQGLWDTPIEKLPIWSAIAGKDVIAINWSYKWCYPLYLLFSDYRFIALEYENIKNYLNLIARPDDWYNRKDDYQKFYKEHPKGLQFFDYPFCNLSGERAIAFAESKKYDEIYLLGFDCCEIDGKTHYYDDDTNKIGKFVWKNRQTTGVGKNEFGYYNTSVYNKQSTIDNQFKKFTHLKNKVFNVSPESKIDLFPKIDYKEFYERIK